jgi:hypothetical protein
LNLAADHSNKAKEYVFVILKLDESEFGNELEAECRKIENVAQLDTYCKEKAMTIFEAMTNDRRNSISDLHDRSFDANLSAWCRTDFA